MKILITYYSRTGTTKKVAEKLAEILKCDVEEIIDTQNRKGVLGYLKSGRQAMKKDITVIEKIKKNPKDYDMIIIGTPIWVHTMSTPVRTFIAQNKENMKKVAFFCTMGGSGWEKTFKRMEYLCGKKPAGILYLKTKEVMKEEHLEKVKKFAEEINN